ncbi:MAG: hypothetical protein ACRDQ4_28060, partial [Pseudonocardiaceae bacterium]
MLLVSPPPGITPGGCAGDGFLREVASSPARLVHDWGVVLVAERLFTIPITCYFDRRAHEVTDENIVAGRRAGHYEALCGYRVVAAAMAAPVGRSCPECVAVVVAARSPAVPARRGRHRRPGWLRRILRPSCVTGTGGPVCSRDSRAGVPLLGGGRG